MRLVVKRHLRPESLVELFDGVFEIWTLRVYWPCSNRVKVSRHDVVLLNSIRIRYAYFVFKVRLRTLLDDKSCAITSYGQSRHSTTWTNTVKLPEIYMKQYIYI